MSNANLTRNGSHTEFLRFKYRDITPEIIYSSSQERISLLKDTRNIARTIAIFRFDSATWSESIIKINTEVENGVLISDATKLYGAELLRQHITYCKLDLPIVNYLKNLENYLYGQSVKIYIKEAEFTLLYGILHEFYHLENFDKKTLNAIKSSSPKITPVHMLINEEFVSMINHQLIKYDVQ